MIPKYILKHSQQAKAFGTNKQKNVQQSWNGFTLKLISLLKCILNAETGYLLL